MTVAGRLRELLEKAKTDDTWVVAARGQGRDGWDGISPSLVSSKCIGAARSEDAALIVAAVNALPALLDVAEAADKVPRSGHTDRVGLTAALARLHAQPEQTEEESDERC